MGSFVVVLAGCLGALSAVAIFLAIVTHRRVGAQVADVERLAEANRRLAITAQDGDRAGCQRNNAIREAVALFYEGQVRQTDRLLKEGLGALEQFRPTITERNDHRRRILRTLRIPAAGRYQRSRRYALNCEAVYPPLRKVPRDHG